MLPHPQVVANWDVSMFEPLRFVTASQVTPPSSPASPSVLRWMRIWKLMGRRLTFGACQRKSRRPRLKNYCCSTKSTFPPFYSKILQRCLNCCSSMIRRRSLAQNSWSAPPRFHRFLMNGDWWYRRQRLTIPRIILLLESFLSIMLVRDDFKNPSQSIEL